MKTDERHKLNFQECWWEYKPTEEIKWNFFKLFKCLITPKEVRKGEQKEQQQQNRWNT